MTRIFSIILIFIFLSTTCLFAQKNVQIYYDASGNESYKDGAYYFTLTNKENDTSWMVAYYNNNGPLRKLEHYKEKKCTNKNGRFAYYNLRGFIDSTGNFINGTQGGKWVIYDNYGTGIQEKEYQDGLMIESKDLDLKKVSNYDSANLASSNPNEVQSKFPGGDHAWQQYMFKNMKIPDEVIKNATNGLNGTVIVGFTIEADGTVKDIYVVKSRLYELDRVAIDLIKNSGKWIPAAKDGVKVKSYKKQPIVFKIINM
jgi:TonB family protein